MLVTVNNVLEGLSKKAVLA